MPYTVSELDALKIENSLLRTQALEAQFVLLKGKAKDLADERQALLAAARTSVGICSCHDYDPSLRAFVKNPKMGCSDCPKDA